MVFFLAAGLRVYRQWKLPLHLRWELYPVKHEVGKKADYGGSYMEELNWWEKEKKNSLYNELKFIIPEILFLRGVWQENRQLWKVSFPFHFGLYMLLATLVLLFVGAVAMIFGAPITAGGSTLRALIYYLTILVGFVGLTMGTVGGIGLIYRRVFDPALKSYSSFADYFNLAFLFLFMVAGLLAWLFHDHGFDGARAYIYSLLTFGGQPEGYTSSRSFLGKGTIMIASLVMAYIPMTHMSHMFMKYFMYHFVRWDDKPNLKGSRIEASILKNLGFKPTWAAGHIGADGEKTWVDIATSGPKGSK
ncbi:MAG: respiratory nitrate reductase subunit gamma [Pseudomonadota bacterium]